MNILLRVRLTWNFSIVSSEREHRFIWTSVQTINEAVLCTRLQHSTDYSHHRSEFRVNPPNGPAAHQEVARREMIPNDALHLPTEAPDPMAVVWTAAVVQDRSPASHTMLWLVRLSRAALWLVKSFSTSWPTCHMIRWGEFEPRTGGNSASVPVIVNQIKIYQATVSKNLYKIYQGLHKYMKCFQHWYKREMFLEQQISIW